MSAVLKFNDYEFSTTGRPQYGQAMTYSGATEGGARDRRTATWTIDQWFLEPSFADNEARYRALLAALNAGEGVLYIADEHGSVLVNQRVRVAANDLPAQWGQNIKEVKVTFTATEEITGASPFSATYTPVGSATALVLPNVSSFKETIRSDRLNSALPNRRETLGLVLMSGRLRPGAALDPTQRRTFLLGKKAELEAINDSKSGTLVFGEYSKEVRIDTLEADVSDGTDELSWSLTASYRRFPSGDYAEAEYEISTSDDEEARQRTTSVRGTIRADDLAGAEAKAQSIREQYAAQAGVLKKSESTHRHSDGTDGATFVELSFLFDFRAPLAGAASYKLTITSKDDRRSGQVAITYSGSATAADTASALAKARDLGLGKHPIQLNGTETISTVGTAGGAEEVQEVAFSYEYLTKGEALFAEVTSERERATFGTSSQNVSGTAVAATQALAETLARSFKPTGLLLRSDRESVESIHLTAAGPGGVSQFVKVTFAYSYHLAKTGGSIQFARRTSEDVERRELTTNWSGTAWASSEAAADALIDGIIAGAPGRKGVNERTSNYDSSTQTAFISRSFNVSRITPMAASGDDILLAEFSIEKTFSVNRAVITPIPYGVPHVQPNVGVSPGSIVVSGSITALNLATARTWARTKQPAGGYADEPRERESYLLTPFSGTQVNAHRFEFTYFMRYPVLPMV